MRILLIGGNGFIGRHVVSALRQQGHSLAVFHRGTAPSHGNTEEIHGDRNNLSASARDFQRFAPDVVIDFVLSSGPQAETLVKTCRGLARRLVMLSSMDVYRAIGISLGMEDGPLQPVPLTEDSELRRKMHPYPPEQLHGLRQIFSWATDDYDKIPAERVVMNDPDLPGTVLRLPMIYGPGDPLHRFYPVVKRIFDKRSHIIFEEKISQWRTPRGYIENVAAAIALATTDDRSVRRIYNVAEQPAFSELDWAKKIADAMRWTGKFITLPAERTPAHLLRPGNASQHWEASSERIRYELGYQEPVALDEAIRRTIDWEKDNPPPFPFLAPLDYPAEDAAVSDRQ